MKITATIVLSFCSSLAFSQLKAPSLPDIWQSDKFQTKGVSGFSALNDGEHYLNVVKGAEPGEQHILKYRIKDGLLVDTFFQFQQGAAWLKKAQASVAGYMLSPDEKTILFKGDYQQIYRHSYASNFTLLSRTGQSPFTYQNRVMYPTFSPDNQMIAFVEDNNLMVLNTQNKSIIKVTSDGKKNEIINGAVDWVYEEEFSMSQGFSWSPDGQYIAYYRFDETEVPEFSMDIFSGLYPKQERWKYPKAGERNSVVQIFIYDILNQQSVLCQTKSGPDTYLPRMQWTNEPGVLSIQVLNRHQNHLELLYANASTGETKVVLEEKNKWYIDVNDQLEFIGNQIVMLSEQNGYRQLHAYDVKTKKWKQLIKEAKWDIDAYYGYDASSGNFYFNAADEVAWQRNLFAFNLKSGKLSKLNRSKGWNQAMFTAGYRYFLHIYSNAKTPPVFTLSKANGDVLRTLENNEKLKSTLAQHKLGNLEFTTIKTDSGVLLNAYVVKPVDFDANKKYPVLFYVYGGPGSQTVKDSWGGAYYLWFSHLADLGYVVVSVDNRGTGFRGEEFKKCTYLQLGKFEIADQIGAARAMAKNSWIDANRMGIWGWSYGGYMSSLGITVGSDVFKTAVAVAPVTNWRYYDNIYTERYMRTPQENAEGYDLNSPINHVSKIKGNYLIIHGTADDNVHFQNAVEMVNKMIAANVKFDSEYYPNRNHGIGGGNARIHLFEKITRYLQENL